MLYDDKEILRCLRALAQGDEDLLQEVWVHIWLVERENPGKTRSWYLQNCWFHLRHSVRRRQKTSLRSMPFSNAEAELLTDESESSSVVGNVHARQLLIAVFARLPPTERTIFQLLAQDYSVREIARLLRISKTQVCRHRESIEAAAKELGLIPCTVTHRRR